MKQSNSIQEYRQLDKKELKSKVADFTLTIMKSYTRGVKENRNRLKKEIAKIKTVLNEQSYKDKGGK